MSNKNIKEYYEGVYKAGEENIKTFYENGVHISEDHPAILNVCEWEGKEVIDIGCGTGTLARELSSKNAKKVIGLDISSNAIELAKEKGIPHNVEFKNEDIMNWKPNEPVDIVVSLGTIEHIQETEKFLNRIKKFIKPDGCIYLTCPHFINLRGFVWMSLNLLLDVPMSLADIHFFHPWQLKEISKKCNLQADLLKTIDKKFAYGPKLVKDFNKRLTNALRDANLNNKNVPKYMNYLENLIEYIDYEDNFEENISFDNIKEHKQLSNGHESRMASGVTAVYKLTKNNS